MAYKRYSGRYLRFDVRTLNEDDAKKMYESLQLKDFVALERRASENGWYRCYATRRDGKAFNFQKGVKTLAKKLRVRPADVRMVHLSRYVRMPDQFFQLLSSSDRLEEQIFLALGQYSDPANIELCLAGQDPQETSDVDAVAETTRFAGSEIDEAGFRTSEVTVPTRETGIVDRYGREEIEPTRSDCLLAKHRDVPAGKSVYLPFVGCRKRYEVTSWSRRCTEAGTSGNSARAVGPCESLRFPKDVHYFFYSDASGPGKTEVVTYLVRHFNAAVVNDANNWTGVSETVQFLIMDEYGGTNRLRSEDLKRLTSGNATTFAGNRKSYGRSYVPRSDVQVILFSDKHLFDCCGTFDRKLNRRTVTPDFARSLLARFHVYKLDEGIDGVTTELEDRMRHTSSRLLHEAGDV